MATTIGKTMDEIKAAVHVVVLTKITTIIQYYYISMIIEKLANMTTMLS